jgi:hypothetical protein
LNDVGKQMVGNCHSFILPLKPAGSPPGLSPVDAKKDRLKRSKSEKKTP